MRILFLKFVVICGSVQTVKCDVLPTQTLSNAVSLSTARFNAVRLRGNSGRKPVRQPSASWKPMCLGQWGKRVDKHKEPLSRTAVTAKDIKIFSNPEPSENPSPDGTLSLKGMPPEYFAILSTSSQNSSALMQNYAGVSGGMDLFGIRAMFVSPTANSMTSDFGATDLHHFY